MSCHRCKSDSLEHTLRDIRRGFGEIKWNESERQKLQKHEYSSKKAKYAQLQAIKREDLMGLKILENLWYDDLRAD